MKSTCRISTRCSSPALRYSQKSLNTSSAEPTKAISATNSGGTDMSDLKMLSRDSLSISRSGKPLVLHLPGEPPHFSRAPPERPACPISWAFVRDQSQVLGGGEGRLFINGKLVAKSVLPRFYPPLFFKGASENSIGHVYGSPVSPDYRAPFEFTGLKKVQIELFDGMRGNKVAESN